MRPARCTCSVSCCVMRRRIDKAARTLGFAGWVRQCAARDRAKLCGALNVWGFGRWTASGGRWGPGGRTSARLAPGSAPKPEQAILDHSAPWPSSSRSASPPCSQSHSQRLVVLAGNGDCVGGCLATAPCGAPEEMAEARCSKWNAGDLAVDRDGFANMVFGFGGGYGFGTCVQSPEGKGTSGQKQRRQKRNTWSSSHTLC